MDRQDLFEKVKEACDHKYQTYLLCREIAERSAEPEMRDIFDKIARETIMHRDAIMKRYSLLDFK